MCWVTGVSGGKQGGVVENGGHTSILFQKLLGIMDSLRSPEGCPWDREQTHQSIRSSVIEEAYEVAQAIDDGDPAKLCEELGDLLLQVVFHSQIAMEAGTFDLAAVIEGISSKLITRHPHVFGEHKLDTADEVVDQWEAIKAQHRKSGSGSLMDDLPSSFPALMLANRVQKRAAQVGFDWDSPEDALSKLQEEVSELESALIAESSDDGCREAVFEEVGDLLFSTVNVARLMKMDAEYVLQRCVHKFVVRFRNMEKQAEEQGVLLNDMSLTEMDVFWEAVKKSEVDSDGHDK